MRKLLVLIALLALAGCGNSEARIREAETKLHRVREARGPAELAKNRCVAAFVEAGDPKTPAEMDAVFQSIPACKDHTAARKLAEAEEDLKDFCAKNLEACETVRRREAVVQ